MKIEKTTTGLIIHQPTDEVKRLCLRYFSLRNPLREYFIYSGHDSTNKSFFGKEHDVIYITSGFLSSSDKVKNELTGIKTITPKEGDKVSFEMKYLPRSQFQIDCIKDLTTSKCPKITVEAKPGLGKMAPYSTHIPTPTAQGYTLMGNLHTGDYVFDKNGCMSHITGIFEQGIKRVFKITFSDGRTSMCGEHHLWNVRAKNDNVWQCKTLVQIMSDNYREIEYEIPTCGPVKYRHEDVPIDPWVLGCFLNAGCLTNEYLTISTIMDDIPKKIIDIYPNLDYEQSYPDSIQYKFIYKNNKEYVKTKDFFKDIPMIVNLSRNKCFVPNIYLHNDVNTRFNVLKGISDTVPCVSDPSLLLSEHISHMIYSLGMSSSKFLTSSMTDVNSCKSDTNITIVDIHYDHMENCRCIMVANSEHLYLTDEYLVTHNTFIALDSISKLGLKPLIVVPTTLLKNQWLENLIELGIEKNDIATDIRDATQCKFCISTISVIENMLRDDWEGLLKAIDDANFGIKITDEAHLHLKGVLKLDAITNIKHNWYLSATLGRSDISEDNVLNRALSDADRFVGNSTYIEYQQQYVNVYFQNIYYYPSAKLCNDYLKYGTKGLIRATYYNMLMAYKDGTVFVNNILFMIKRAKQLASYGKVLVLVPILSTIDAVIKAMGDDHYFDKYKCTYVNGKMPLLEKRESLDGDIILATTQSVGTGTDIKDLSIVINFDQYASPIITEQIFGRLRNRFDKKETYYIDICDFVRYAKTLSTWGRKRRMLIPYFPGAKSQIKKFNSLSG